MIPAPPVQPAYADTPDNAAEQQKLFRIATAQRLLIWAILAQFLALLPVPYIVLIPVVFSVIAVYWLASALENRMAILYTIASLIPFVGIISLLIVNAAATKYLQGAGIKVGLMGVSPDAIKNLGATQ